MESPRSFMFIALALVSYLLFIEWQRTYHAEPVTVEAPNTQSSSTSTIPIADPQQLNQDIPQSTAAETSIVPSRVPNTELIQVKTNVLDIRIDPKGGDIVSAVLLDYPVKQNEPKLIELFSQYHTAQSGLIGQDGPDGRSEGRPNYSVEQTIYTSNDQDIEVRLQWRNDQGIQITKIYSFKANEYDINLAYLISNNSSKVASIQQFAQLKKVIFAPESSLMLNAYNAATYSTAEERYEKYDLDDMREKTLNKLTLGGWVAMQQHYFVAAWVPSHQQQNNIFSRVAADGSAIIGFKGPLTAIQPGETTSLESTLYAGPKIQKDLGALSESLELTVDYGPLWFISQFLFWIMTLMYEYIISNWGVAIIILTIVVKFGLYPLTKKQTISMAKMRNLQPKLQQLKERYGDDRQKMGPAMMELYRKENVNPVGGCLPLLLQMPIFLALYWMLMESVELRHADFFLWITDLSSKDPYFVLPVLYGASMYLMQKLMPTPVTDPLQQKMMTWMPVVFSIFFVIFPAGLVLYWLVNNIISILQTLYIHRQIDRKGLAQTTSNKKSTAK